MKLIFVEEEGRSLLQLKKICTFFIWVKANDKYAIKYKPHLVLLKDKCYKNTDFSDSISFP